MRRAISKIGEKSEEVEGEYAIGPPPPSMGEGEGGGECPNRVPPHLYPLLPRGEEVFCMIIF
jgi:hypothetical protein